MKCVYCKHIDSKVLDSRYEKEANVIKRRRECLACTKRFTTKELIETSPVLVIKSNGSRELFDINKIKNGVIKSCQKRTVALEQIDTLAGNVARKIYNKLEPEVPSSIIGEFVMEELKSVDDVAYVRFASVYRKFTDVTTFVNFIEERIGGTKSS